MNKTAIKNFAVWARQKLIDDIRYKAEILGITDKGIAEKLPHSTTDLHFFDIGTKNYTEVSGKDIEKRDSLIKAIKRKEDDINNYKEAFQYIIEEVAYTWFNRLIAIRFMEVNNYLPSGIRILSSENKMKNEPDFVTTPFDTDIEFTSYEQDKVIKFKDENKLDELFRMLFIKQCNKFHNILPELFEKTDDYYELLLTISFTDKDGIVYSLVHDIDEDDFDVKKEGRIEIVGWLYQYYNTELKDKVFANLKKNIKISKENIPAATQLFTPDWIVRYMVENSLGRIFISDSGKWLVDNMTEEERIAKEKEVAEQFSWKYYLPEAEQTPEVRQQLITMRSSSTTNFDIKDIKVIDPCMGSGHILVYAFDVLMQIYTAQGYTERDAAKSIIENNLFGMDIDKRAYQLAYFAVMMKARQYNRRILNGEVKPSLFAIDDSTLLTNNIIDFISNNNEKLKKDLQSIKDDLYNAKEYGSIIDVTPVDFATIYTRIDEIKDHFYEDFFGQANQKTVLENVLPIIKQAEIMAQKYDVVVTNPPYMGSSGMSRKLSDFVKKKYPYSKSDLFAVFMERCGQMVKKNCYQSMITQHAWMFISSYEKLRTKLLSQDTVNMAHLGSRAFEEIGGEVVQTTSFVLRKSHVNGYKGVYCRLIEPTTQQGKEDMFLARENRYEASQDNFSKIPGSPIAYFFTNNMFCIYDRSVDLKQIAAPRKGNSTSDNNRFLRLWYEVDFNKLNIGCYEIIREETLVKRWYPYNKGGGYRKWYGFQEYMCDWYDDAQAIRKIPTAVIANYQYFMKPGLTWSTVTSSNFSIRAFDNGFIFDNGGCCIFDLGKLRNYLCGLLNSNVFKYIFGQLNPTLNFQSGEVAKFPVIEKPNDKIDSIVTNNISLSRADWDSFETSWDFKKHPLI